MRIYIRIDYGLVNTVVHIFSRPSFDKLDFVRFLLLFSF